MQSEAEGDDFQTGFETEDANEVDFGFFLAKTNDGNVSNVGGSLCARDATNQGSSERRLVFVGQMLFQGENNTIGYDGQ